MLLEQGCPFTASWRWIYGNLGRRALSSGAHRVIPRSILLDAGRVSLPVPGTDRERLSPRYLRRWIFELHAGRELPQLPTDLDVDSMNAPTTTTDKRRDNFTTAEDLIEALGPVGWEYATPSRYASKLDLSFIDPLKASSDRELAERQIALKKEAQKRGPAIESKAILLSFLNHIAPHVQSLSKGDLDTPELDQGLSRLFTAANHEWLQQRGWDVENVMTWAWILEASSPDKAASRFYNVAHKSIVNEKGFLFPVWILLFVLRRQNLSAHGLKYLLRYITEMMEVLSTRNDRSGASLVEPAYTEKEDTAYEKVISSPHAHQAGITEDVFIVMVIRLLRRARETWPAACETIMSLSCRFLNGLNFNENAFADYTRLSFQYNTLLKLLALPSSLQPYIAAAYQQRAQNIVLRRMNDFNPPLVVDQRGYQAVARVQLMFGKNAREREWAMLKAPSWPPWKRDRLGIDASIGHEHGISRTNEILDDAEQAGYASTEWDKSASILAGWDTDGTPTIQSRRSLAWLKNQSAKSQLSQVWASRIHATRTMNEAWAIFQSYQPHEPAEGWKPREPYRALLEKIVHFTERNAGTVRPRDDNQDLAILPGDGTEVFPEPSLPRDTTHVSTKAPDYVGFHEMLQARSTDGASLCGGKLLIQLIYYAPSLYMLVKVLMQADLHWKFKRALLHDDSDASFRKKRFRVLKEYVPSSLLSKFIINLSKHRLESLKDDQIRSLQSICPDKFQIAPLLASSPLLWAWRLTREMKLTDRPIWLALLRARSQDCYIRVESSELGNDERGACLRAWSSVLNICSEMSELNVSLDLEAIWLVLRALENALIAAERIIRLEGAGHSSRLVAASRVVEEGLPTVKTMFKDAVRADSYPEPVTSVSADDGKDKVQPDPMVLNKAIAFEDDVDDGMPDEEQGISESPKSGDPSTETKTFVAPASLLPRLLEVPRPAFLHQFIRVLGLYGNYEGLLDLLEWMALYADELEVQAAAQRNGSRLARSSIVAVRVFLERSWVYYDIPDRKNHVLLERDVDPAPLATWEMIKRIIAENPGWGGWPEDREVEEYVMKGRFI